jgi:hypothetical protein
MLLLRYDFFIGSVSSVRAGALFPIFSFRLSAFFGLVGSPPT